MGDKRVHERLAAVAALQEPARRDLYLHVAGAPGPVSRDQAARALGITRALAAFHLDKLVEAGLLEAGFARLSGRGGPGAGRPSKLYRRAPGAIEISLPQRRYELAGELMAEALTGKDGAQAREALRRSAREHGRQLARGTKSARGGSGLARVMTLLRREGFEPVREKGGEVFLRNCPFDALARRSKDLVCGMNLALVEGVVEGLEARDVSVCLDPKPGRCCVALRRAAGA